MHTVPAYERDAYLQELETEVVGTGVDDGRRFSTCSGVRAPSGITWRGRRSQAG
jgi:hypothetical protein